MFAEHQEGACKLWHEQSTSHTSTLGCSQPELGVPDRHVQEVPMQEAASQRAQTIWEMRRARPVSSALPTHPGKPGQSPHLAAHVSGECLQPHAGSSSPQGLRGWWQPLPWQLSPWHPASRFPREYPLPGADRAGRQQGGGRDPHCNGGSQPG